MGEAWRLLPHHAGSTALHFRLADALARCSMEPTFWSHSGAEPTLLLGAGQKPASFDTAGSSLRQTPAIRAPGLSHPNASEGTTEVVQRQSGGTAVLAGENVLGIDVALPKDHYLAPGDIIETYRWFGETWVEALDLLGIESRVLTVAEARAASLGPEELRAGIAAACFGSLSPWELVSGNRKLVGLAQVRRQHAVLLQSAVHIAFDPIGLAELLMPESAHALGTELARRAAGLADVSERAVAIEDVVQAFQSALVKRLDVELRPGQWTEAELEYAGASYLK